jgi:hypothetical protein
MFLDMSTVIAILCGTHTDAVAKECASRLRTVSIFSEKNSKLNSSTLPFLNYSKFPSLIFYCWCEKATPVDEKTAKSISREKMIKYEISRQA